MTSDSLIIEEAAESDFPQIWQIFHQVVSAGDTFAYDPDGGYVGAHVMFKWLSDDEV